jgi:hypothetical protein
VKVRFLADANFNQNIVAGLLLREPAIDFALPQALIPERMKDRCDLISKEAQCQTSLAVGNC